MNLWRKTKASSLQLYAHIKNSVYRVSKGAANQGSFFLLILCFLPVQLFSQELTDTILPFDIPKQRADLALIQFAEQAGLTFFVAFDELEGITSNKVSGTFPVKEALSSLLLETGLKATISAEKQLFIESMPSGEEGNMNNNTRLSTGILGALLSVFTVGAVAQGDTESVSPYAIDEIIVSSRRIEEGLQDAPLAITAISGVELENRGALDIIDFADVAPNVSLKTNGAISGFGAAPRTSIRGVGQSDFVINTDPAVGIYADGVYLGRSLGSVLDLVDVERVEALRGPQGTLFGRNSTGGAINIISKKPEIGEDTSGYLTASAGEDGYTLLRGSVNFGITDSSAARLTVMNRERDGFIPILTPDPIYNGFELGAEDVFGIRGAFRWEASDSFILDLDADYSERSDSPAAIIPVLIGDLSVVGQNDLTASGVGTEAPGQSSSQFIRRFNGEPLAGPPINNPALIALQAQNPLCGTDENFRNTSMECAGHAFNATRDGSYQAWFDREGNFIRPDDQSLETYGFSARAEWATDNFTVKSISSWRGFDSSFVNGSPAFVFTGGNNNERFDQDQFSQEITIDGAVNDGRLRWLLGAFYQEEDGVETVVTVFPFAPPANNGDPDFLPINGIEDRSIDNTSVAVYGQLNFDITDNLELTLGARHTDEEKKF